MSLETRTDKPCHQTLTFSITHTDFIFHYFRQTEMPHTLKDINYSSLFTNSQNSSYNYSSPQNRSTCGSAVDISSISFYCEDASADGHTSNTSYHYNTTSEIISFNYNKEQNAIKNQQKAASIQIPKRKHHLSNEAVGLMTEWFDSHVANPYPTLEKKELMASVGKITVKQVISWFSNRRNR